MANTKIIIHKRDRFQTHKVTVKFDDWITLSMLLAFARDGMEAYIEKMTPGNEDSNMHKHLTKSVEAIKGILEIEDTGGYIYPDLRGVLEVDL